jgi:hypothetical protein
VSPATAIDGHKYMADARALTDRLLDEYLPSAQTEPKRCIGRCATLSWPAERLRQSWRWPPMSIRETLRAPQTSTPMAALRWFFL